MVDWLYHTKSNEGKSDDQTALSWFAAGLSCWLAGVLRRRIELVDRGSSSSMSLAGDDAIIVSAYIASRQAPISIFFV